MSGELASLALRVEPGPEGRVLLLDQRRLPDEERWLDATAPADLIDAIRGLAVRGAPLLGVAAAATLGKLAAAASAHDWRAAAAAIRVARPTAVNLRWAVDRLAAVHHSGGDVAAEADAVFREDVALADAMSRHGAALVADGEDLLTHCNTGGLATVGIGTALGVVIRAHRDGKRVHVWVDETRPLLQGGRLTAWECARQGVPHTLVTDSMAAVLMRAGRVSRVLVGADRVAANGDFANKIGTYGVAVAAAFHGVPFHPVAPFSTVDPATADGAGIPIEEREPDEVRGFGATRWAPRAAPVWNPAFDVTPVGLVTSLVTDRGVFDREALAAGALASGQR